MNGNIYYTGGSFSKVTYRGVPVIQRVDSFTLINADNAKAIQTLRNGATINLATLPTRNLNIRANTSPATVGSVVFNLSGKQTKNVTESRLPYALFGDNNNGRYYAWTPAPGTYSLKATPYSSAASAGVAGRGLSISFTVTTAQGVVLSSAPSTVVAGAEADFSSLEKNVKIPSYIQIPLMAISMLSCLLIIKEILIFYFKIKPERLITWVSEKSNLLINVLLLIFQNLIYKCGLLSANNIRDKERTNKARYSVK